MKILWVTNQATFQLAKAINIPAGLSGGWMSALSVQLAACEDVSLLIAFPVTEDFSGKMAETVNGVHGVCIPLNKNARKPQKATYEKYIEVIKDYQPDLIHIWGTEYAHTYSAIQASNALNKLDVTVISIQGLVSIHHSHFWGHIRNKREMPVSFRDLAKSDGLRTQEKSFYDRGVFEEKAIQLTRHVIGRTDWDKACCENINPDAEYHFCNETLRDVFYKKKWAVEKCERHSIFLTQSHYPLKGFHLFLQALPKILERYPDAHVYTTGKNRMVNNFISYAKLSSYDLYIRKMIKKFKLEDKITFLGQLGEEEMCDRFLKSHVFVSASVIENSPNSVGEAMILGVPTITTDVGGVKNLLEHGKEGFTYPADEPYMLPFYISKIFNDDDLAMQLSEKARNKAHYTHSPEKNLSQLLEIYKNITAY